MTDHKQELQRLLADVEAGRQPETELILRALSQHVPPGLAPLMPRLFKHIMAPKDISAMGYVKVLHEALLPEWNVDDMSQNGMLAGHPWGIQLEKWGYLGSEPVTAGWGKDACPDDNPAHAWLIAILKALIWEADNA